MVNAGSIAYLVITTTLRTAVAPPSITTKRLRIDLLPEILPVLGISLFTLFAFGKRRILSSVPLGVMALLLVLIALGCGSSPSGNTGGGGTTNPNGTPVGTYTITITGSSSVSTTVKLTVT
jgi:hypothetical protein